MQKSPEKNLTTEKRPWDQTPASRIMAVLIVFAVGLVGFSSHNSDDEDATPVVQGFFTVLNKQNPTYSDFSKYATGTTSTKIREAIRYSRQGGYSVVSVGPITDERSTRVEFTHGGQTFTTTMALSRESRNWKLDKPFPTVVFRSTSDDARFHVSPTDTTSLRLEREYTMYPGKHIVTPLSPSRSAAAAWEPVTPEFTLLTGRTTVTIEGKVTAEAEAEIMPRITEAFDRCLRMNEFEPRRCPNQVRVPAQTNGFASVAWSITPADAPSRPVFAPEHSFVYPCYVISGVLTYTYSDRNGTPVTAQVDPFTATGCTSLVDTTVTWKT